jgi:competence protein ComER
MKVGFIGTGSMGRILIDAFLQTEAFTAKQVVITNRTFHKAEQLATQYPGILAVRTNEEVARHSDLLFICVKPRDYKEVIEQIKTNIHPDQIVISITSPVLISWLEYHLSGKIAKVIPSITNFSCSGVTLTCYGERMKEKDIRVVEELLKKISKPHNISENFTRVSSDLSSCGPAFVALFLEKFIAAAVNQTGISEDEAITLASEMLYGTGKLLISGNFTPQSLRERVTVPGGITAAGLQILNLDLEHTFEHLIEKTHAKYREELAKLGKEFEIPSSHL